MVSACIHQFLQAGSETPAGTWTVEVSSSPGWACLMAMAVQVRGEEDVELEYNTIVVANEAVRSLENPWVSIMRRK